MQTMSIKYIEDFSYEKTTKIAVYNRKGSKRPNDAIRGVNGYGITPICSYPRIMTTLKFENGDSCKLDLYSAFKIQISPVSEKKVNAIFGYMEEKKIPFELERIGCGDKFRFKDIDLRKIQEEATRNEE